MLRRGGGPVPKQIHSQATSFSLPSLLHLPGGRAQAQREQQFPFCLLVLQPQALALEGPALSSGQGESLSLLGGPSPIIVGTEEKAELGGPFHGLSSIFRRLGPQSISDHWPQSGGPGASLSGWESQHCLLEPCHLGQLSSRLCPEDWQAWFHLIGNEVCKRCAPS